MKNIDNILDDELKNIKNAGLYKNERQIESSQSSIIQVSGEDVVNFCANNYLGLSNHPLLSKQHKMH